jgi:hypothetical protein
MKNFITEGQWQSCVLRYVTGATAQYLPRPSADRRYYGRRTVLPLLLLTVAAFLISPIALGQDYFSPPQYIDRTSSMDLTGDGSTCIATDGAGNWVAVWRAGDLGDDDTRILVSRSTDAGASWSPAASLNPSAPVGIDELDPQIAADGTGTFVAAWSSGNPQQGDRDVLVSRSTDGGVTWSSPVNLSVNASIYPEQRNPEVATDGAGNWLIVWFAISTSEECLLISRSTDGGATWSDPVPRSGQDEFGYDHHVEVATDGAGTWVMAWCGSAFGDDLDVLVSRSTDGGVTWSDATWVNSSAPNDAGLANQDSARLYTDGAGMWIVLWDERIETPEVYGGKTYVAMSRSTDGGVTWSPTTFMYREPADRSELDNGSAPHLATDGTGTWVAVWQRGGVLSTFGLRYYVMTAFSTDNGMTWSRTECLTDIGTDPSYNYRPHVATDRLGNWVIVWERHEADWDGFGRRIAVSQSISPTFSIGHPSSAHTTAEPVSFTIDYGDASSITLSASDITLLSTGTATGTVSVTDNGDNTRTVTINSISGLGTLSLSVAPGTARGVLGTLADAFTSSYEVHVYADLSSLPLRWWLLTPILGVVALVTLLRFMTCSTERNEPLRGGYRPSISSAED